MAKIERLFIAEKKNLAGDIAQALGDIHGTKPTMGSGSWSVGPDVVTWVSGHMLESAPPEAYGQKWAKWTLESLPIVVPEGQWKLVVVEDKKRQTQVVQGLIRDARQIVNAGDPGREGQLLIDELLLYSNRDAFGPDIHRLWAQSLVRKDLVASLKALLPNASKQALYDSAFCRQRADWQHGMSNTRLFRILAQRGGSEAKVTVGRVQTPTLRLVVDRDLERLHFKPVDHFLPKIVFNHDNGSFTASWVIPQEWEGLDSEGRLIEKAVAQKLIADISGKPGRISAYKAETKFTAQRLPYSLATLQSEAGSKFSLTAQEVLDIAQKLYDEHKIASYPRTSSAYLPTAMRTEVAPGVIAQLRNTPEYAEMAGGADTGIKSPAWDDSKITDHYGIVPTAGYSPAKLAALSPVEKSVFGLIVKAFIAQFYPAEKYKATAVEVMCEKLTFKANGRVVIDPGWKRLYGKSEDDEAEDSGSGQSLPAMAQGDGVVAQKGDISATSTKKPPAFTDASLIIAMLNAHRFETNPEYKKQLKDGDGIGTDATRGSIIEGLIARKFLKREGKTGLASTEVGRSIITNLPDDLKALGLTARWEKALTMVAEGKMTAAQFMEAQKQSLTEIVAKFSNSVIAIKGGGSSVRPIDGHGEACPTCGTGVLVTKEVRKDGPHKGKKFLACSQPECKYTRWEEKKVPAAPGHGKECPSCKAGKLLTVARTSKKDNKEYIFLACTNKDACQHREWPEKPKVEAIAGDGQGCPKCQQGTMKTILVTKEGANKGKKFLGCSNRECRHTMWPEEKIPSLPGDGKRCATCGKGKMGTRIVRKEGPNKGKRFLACSEADCKTFEWPEEPGGGPGAGKPGASKPGAGNGRASARPTTRASSSRR